MLHIYLGNCEKEIYQPSVYFNHQYEDEWLSDEFVKAMVLDIDKSTVISPRMIDSPILGMIGPKELSGGVKTLILMKQDDSGVWFNASACGDNCADWILKIAQEKELTITLHHIMKFTNLNQDVEIVNTHEIISDFKGFVNKAINFV